MALDLTVAGVGKTFGAGTKAVDGVTFTVPAGDIAVLLGPSGCGKTTTLRMVAGLETPSVGTVSLGGRLFSRADTGLFLAPQHRKLAMVFQSYAIWPHMSVGENVAYPLRGRGLSRGERRAKVAQALALVGLEDLADRPSAALSGGQMQRVALARSMAYEPDLLLLDEPMSNLDPELRVRLRNDLRSIIKAAGLTALYVTHDQEEAAALADHIGMMSGGRLLQFAPTEILFSRPALPAVARFTGATSQIDGHVLSRDNEVAEIVTAGGTHLIVTPIDDLRDGEATRVLFRPENARLLPPGAASEAAMPRARIVERMYLGGQAVYALDLGASRVEAMDPGTTTRWQVGDEVAFNLDPKGAWAFRRHVPSVSM